MTTKNAAKNDNPETVSMELDVPKFGVEDLRGISNFDDALKLLATAGIELHDAADEMGDGFVIIEDKNKLVGTPLLFLSWNFVKGDFGDFVAARAIAKLEGGGIGKYVIIDGGAGIFAQLQDYSAQHNGKAGGLQAWGGLRRSDYLKDLPDPKTGELVPTPSTTFYVETSAR